IWVEQLAGTGFSSKGSTPDATSEEEKVYITGESYAGLYVPYIADNFIQKNNSRLYDVHGIMIYDPLISYETFMDDIRNRLDACGYTALMEEALTFPPKDLLPSPPNADYSMPGCRHDLPSALRRSRLPREYASLIILPKVIEHTNNVIIGQGMLDYIISYNGTLMAINNITWNGAQGFSKGPSAFEEFFVPYHSELDLGGLAGSGVQGAWHTKRGLTFATVELSGHMVP
ncbi:hypothetical protein D6C80_08406, partial [Aureobasidium pullulans]